MECLAQRHCPDSSPWIFCGKNFLMNNILVSLGILRVLGLNYIIWSSFNHSLILGQWHENSLSEPFNEQFFIELRDLCDRRMFNILLNDFHQLHIITLYYKCLLKLWRRKYNSDSIWTLYRHNVDNNQR